MRLWHLTKLADQLALDYNHIKELDISYNDI